MMKNSKTDGSQSVKVSSLIVELTQKLSLEARLPDSLHAALRLISSYVNASYSLLIHQVEGDVKNVLSFGNPPRAFLESLSVADIKSDICLLDSSDNNAIKYIFSTFGAGIFIRLRLGPDFFGYVLLGPKRNGRPFSRQDLDFAEICQALLAQHISISEQIESLSSSNEGLKLDLARTESNLSDSQDKLQNLDSTKDDFISMASHQLRTPLTSIKGYISMILDGDAGKVNATQKRMLEQAFISSERMVFLIADLLNLSRLKTGKFILSPVPTDLTELISDEIGQLKDLAKTKSLKMIYVKPKNFPVVMIDETKIRQVIMNFIDNAIYYTGEKGRIEIKLQEVDHSIELRVIDNGIGVPKSECHSLFTKFYRAKNAQKVRPDGTGIGLYMAKKVIVAEGGTVIFESVENKGSTFGFSFPKTKIVSN